MSSTDVFVEREGNRIVLRSEWFPGVAAMCKEVPGASWNKNQKRWSYPLTVASCRSLRRVFTDQLKIGGELSAWAREAIAQEESLRALGKLRDTELRVVPTTHPKMAEAMSRRTYQRVAARFIAEARKVLIADEPAMGKSLECLAGIVEAGIWQGDHLITAPKSALETTWADEIHKWTGDAEAFFMPDGRTKRMQVIQDFMRSQAPARFLIVNPEMLQIKLENWCHQCQLWESADLPLDHHMENHPLSIRIKKQDWPILHETIWNSVIVDESHKYLLGIRGSGPFKKTQVGEGYTALQLNTGGVRIAATGSPLKGKAKNFWPTFHWLRPEQYGSFWQWAETYLEIGDNGFGKTIGDVPAWKEEDLYKSLDALMLRRTRRECQAELPPKDYQNHWVSMSEAQARQYRSMEEQGEALMGTEHVQAIGVLAEFTRLKQLAFGTWVMGADKTVEPATSPKLEWLLHALEERGVTGDPKVDFGESKYVVASQFTKIVDFIESELNQRGIATLKISGAVTSKRRSEVQRDFQSAGGARVLIINVQAGGVSITLDRYCDEMFIMDETWVRDEMIQLEGRIDNRNAEERIAVRTYHYIRTKDTVEQDIAESGLSQDEVQSALLDTRRGVEFAKRLLSGEGLEDK